MPDFEPKLSFNLCFDKGIVSPKSFGTDPSANEQYLFRQGFRNVLENKPSNGSVEQIGLQKHFLRDKIK